MTFDPNQPSNQPLDRNQLDRSQLDRNQLERNQLDRHQLDRSQIEGNQLDRSQIEGNQRFDQPLDSPQLARALPPSESTSLEPSFPAQPGPAVRIFEAPSLSDPIPSIAYADATPLPPAATSLPYATPAAQNTPAAIENTTARRVHATSTTRSAIPTATFVPKKILVLGATSGIAEATCRLWAAQGHSLFLVARNQSKLESVAHDLRTRGATSVDTAVADLDATDGHPALLSHAVNSLQGMDVAYLAHGILGDQSSAEQDFQTSAQILHTNLIAPISLLTWLANYCLPRRAGVLAVLSSVAGDRGRKSNYIYGSSKAGLSAFLGGLRNRIDREGVTVLTIKPGPTRTAMTTAMPKSEKFADPNAVARSIVAAIAAKKDNLYVPFQWQPIMFVIRNIPDRIFKKLNL